MACFLHQPGIVCALGSSHAEVRAALWTSDAPRGIAASDRYSPGRELPLGEVSEALPSVADWPLEHRSRTNALLAAALAPIRAEVEAAVERFGPQRVGVVIGGSTSGVPEGEAAAAFHATHGRWPEGYDYRQQ
jgi:3-oxoacyl-[acyl-carrier-protein] synthase I